MGFRVYGVPIGIILGLYWDIGKENGNYSSIGFRAKGWELGNVLYPPNKPAFLTP